MQPRRGLELGRPFGFPLLVHRSWFPTGALLVVHLSFSAFGGESLPMAIGLGVVATALYFGCVVVHELAHGLIRSRIDDATTDATLFIYGGIARARELLSSASDEAAVALAGPVTSGALGLGFIFLASATFAPIDDLLWTVGIANLALGAVNLLPALPLDGGRLWASVFWKITGDRSRGVRFTARVGQVVGAASVMTGVWLAASGTSAAQDVAAGLWLALAGIFLFSEAAKARRAFAVATSIEEGTAGVWARPFAGRVPVDAPIPEDGGPYAVADDGRLAGILTPNVVTRDRGRRAGDAMIPWSSDLSLSVDEPIATALGRLASVDAGALIVLDERGVVRGVLDPDGVRARLEGA